MSKQNSIFVAAALVALLPLSPIRAAAEERLPAFRLAMMDMMPMGGGAMPQSAPGGAMSGMGDGKMPMGGAMPAQGQNQMPMGAGNPMPPAMQGGGAMSGMGDGKMPMGGAMPAQGQNQMPMGAGNPVPPAMQGGGAMSGMAGGMPTQGQAQTPMAGCGMMEMMQNLMRMGATTQGAPPMQGGPMAGGTQTAGSSTARLEGRIAFLRTELHIADAQAPAWESFVGALRAGRNHLDAARTALQDSTANADPMARLVSFENHLKERVEAIDTTQKAFTTLYGQLDDAQKQIATKNMLPFIGAF